MPPSGNLETLTDDQRSELLTWMELFPMKDVVAMAAAAPPHGFGLKTHITSLRRFYEGAQMIETRHQLTVVESATTSGEAERLERAAAGALTKYALRMASLPMVRGKNLSQITRWLVSAREQEIRADRNKIARERLALDTASEERKRAMSQVKNAAEQSGNHPERNGFLEAIKTYYDKHPQNEPATT